MKAEENNWYPAYKEAKDYCIKLEQEIEGLKQRLESKTNLCLEFETELFRIREGVGKLYELTDNKTVPYIEGVRDAKKYLDNLMASNER